MMVLEKIIHFLVLFGFTRLVAGQLEFEFEPPHVNFILPFSIPPVQLQNPHEVVSHFIFCLSVVADGGCVRREIPQHEVSFPHE